jgi:molybdopterin converting factor small subunit
MITVIVFGTAFRWLRHWRANDPRRLQREATEKSVRESLAKMDAALKAQDAPRFFTAARQALQERLAEKWELPTSRVTVSEIRARLNGNGEEIRSVFQTADEIAYSGRHFTVPDLQQWRAVVQQQLLALS